MKHAKLVPLVTLRREKLSINQIAKQIISFYKNLAVFDENYSQLNVISEKEALNQIINVNSNNAEMLLAEEILYQRVDEIRKMDKVENPQIDFVMDKSIISIGLQTKTHNDTLLTLQFSFLDSKNLKSGISSIVINQNCFDRFEKAKSFLETVKESFAVDYSVIKVSDRDINKVYRGYKAPLGWVTYFSNEYEVLIPDDLEGIEYEHTNDGKYLILTKENPTDSETLEANKEKLISLMGEIKERVPAYSK